MALQIPKEETGSITEIQALPSATVERLLSALKSAPVMSNPEDMAAYLHEQIPSLPTERLSRMLGTLYTLYHIRELSGVEPSRFLDDLLDGMQSSPELQVAKKNWQKVRSLFERLMDIDALNTIAKAYRLQRDGERLYCTAKIMSDIRPVFGSDPAARPLGAVLTHTLKIGYHEGKEHHEFHLVLDAHDLEALSEVVQRALAKDRSLCDVLKEMKLPNLNE